VLVLHGRCISEAGGLVTSRSVWNTSPEVRAEVGIFVHEGREFAAGGAFVSPGHLVCYPHADGTVRAWDGEVLGRYRVVSSRRAIFFGRPSWIGSTYYYMRATVAGHTYSLRGFGTGFVATGRALKGQS
jgi:hypothetical protein